MKTRKHIGLLRAPQLNHIHLLHWKPLITTMHAYLSCAISEGKRNHARVETLIIYDTNFMKLVRCCGMMNQFSTRTLLRNLLCVVGMGGRPMWAIACAAGRYIEACEQMRVKFRAQIDQAFLLLLNGIPRQIWKKVFDFPNRMTQNDAHDATIRQITCHTLHVGPRYIDPTHQLLVHLFARRTARVIIAIRISNSV